jgi:hypothetical protein
MYLIWYYIFMYSYEPFFLKILTLCHNFPEYAWNFVQFAGDNFLNSRFERNKKCIELLAHLILFSFQFPHKELTN